MIADPLLLPLARAALATYDGSAPWFVDNTRTCSVYKSTVLGHPTYAGPGTRTALEMMVDLAAWDVEFHDHPQFGPIHLGFWLDSLKAIQAIAIDLAAQGWPAFLLCGHSKWGSQTRLIHAALKQMGHPPLASRSFEPAMCGTKVLTAYLADQDHGWTQTWNADGPDDVTRMPFWSEWQHQGVVTHPHVPDTYLLLQKHAMVDVVAAIELLAAA
jgi:hypothetical protein